MAKRKPTTKREALERLNASHLRVLKAFRHQTDEITQLRKYVLDMHQMFAREFQVTTPIHTEGSRHAHN